LVKFFDSPKQNEKLEKAQIAVTKRDHLLISESIDAKVYSEDEEPSEVDNGNLIEQPNINLASQTLRLVKDCPTHWNSKYRSWKRLIKLKDAIIWLEANLNISRNLDERKDGQKLRRCLSTFSAEKYPTLSVIYPVIEVLKSEFNSDLSRIEPDIDEC
ncbi:17398_t:CDS:2, partial [Racocetra persica]